MSKLRVLVACEFTGIVREEFASYGHDAWSCDTRATTRGGKHFQTDVRNVLQMGWDLMICHPPCTYLCSSGLHWNKRRKGRSKKTDALNMIQATQVRVDRKALNRLGFAFRDEFILDDLAIDGRHFFIWR